eukprot:gene19116-24950_t
MYKLITTGSIDENDPAKPPKLPIIDQTTEPMNSAYFLHNKVEPDYTNHAQVKDDEPFIGTLDYIFLSKEFTVKSVISLPSIETAKQLGPMPLVDEPSDHLVLGATVELTSEL